MTTKQSIALCALFLIAASIFGAYNGTLVFATGEAMVGYALSALLMGGAVALIVALISTVIGKGFVMTFVNFWGPTSFVAAYFTYYGLTAL